MDLEMEIKDQTTRYTTITEYIEEETGEVIPREEWPDYITIQIYKPIYEKRGNNVIIIRNRIVRKSGQLKIDFGS